MAIDVTATDNYTALAATPAGLVDDAVTAIKAAYTGVVTDSHPEQKHNVYMILKEQIESMEGTA